jgi:hypothetical protein
MEGTIISAQAPKSGPQVKAVSTKGKIPLVVLDTVGMWQQVGFLADVFGAFKRLGLSIDLVATSETNVTLTLDPVANALDAGTLDALVRRHGIVFHEKHRGQLFCDDSAEQIITMLLAECEAGGVVRRQPCRVSAVRHGDAGFELDTSDGSRGAQPHTLVTRFRRALQDGGEEPAVDGGGHEADVPGSARCQR